MNRRERSRINTRYRNQKNDWLYKLMHGLTSMGMVLVLEEPTIDRLLVRSNRMMSRETRDLLKMGLSQGMIRIVADSVFAKYGLPVTGVAPAGTSSVCPACGAKLWAPKYGTKSWNLWRRAKACVSCLYYVDRDDVAAINIVGRGVSAYEPAAVPAPYHGAGRRVAGDWEQYAPAQLVQTLLGAAVVWFPYTGEKGGGQKGSANNPSHMMEDARLLDDRPDVSNCATGISGPPGRLRGLYASWTHPGRTNSKPFGKMAPWSCPRHFACRGRSASGACTPRPSWQVPNLASRFLRRNDYHTVMDERLRIVVGITGSTGAIYGIRVLEELKKLGHHTHLVLSEWGEKCIAMETEYDAEQVRRMASEVSNGRNMAASISSGTHATDGMIVAPCSMKTLSAIANGYDVTLVARAAGVTIKESRRLVLMARESPLSAIHLENMLKLARLGVVILPPVTEFYTRPRTVRDIVDHAVGKCLDQFGIDHGLYRRWGDPQ